MNVQLKARIRQDFPNIQWQGSAKLNDIECGTGWGLLLYSFLLDATNLCEAAGGKLVISQIKNKFGILRIYCFQLGGNTDDRQNEQEYVPENFGKLFSQRPYPANPTLRSIVAHYEMAAHSTCELCGKDGHIDRDVSSWLLPLCHVHAELVRRTRYRDSPEEYDEIDNDAAIRILERIDKLVQDNQKP